MSLTEILKLQARQAPIQDPLNTVKWNLVDNYLRGNGLVATVYNFFNNLIEVK